jgi:hypothetical protein
LNITTIDDISEEEQRKLRLYVTLLEQFELTSTIVASKCPPSGFLNHVNINDDECVLSLVTHIPNFDSITKFERFAIQSHPVAVNGKYEQLSIPITSSNLQATWKDLTTTIYIKHEKPDEDKWENPTKRISGYYYYPPSASSVNGLQCHESLEGLPCQICTGNSGFIKIENTSQPYNCLLSMIYFSEQQVATIDMPPCTSVNVEMPTTLTVLENNDSTQTIMTGLNDVTLLSTCPNEPEQTRQLPKSVSIKANPQCLLKFLNLQNMEDISPLIKIVTLSEEEKRKYIRTFKELVNQNLHKFKDHFNDHGYLYLLIIFSLILLLILLILLRFICLKCYKKYRQQANKPTCRAKYERGQTPYPHESQTMLMLQENPSDSVRTNTLSTPIITHADYAI